MIKIGITGGIGSGKSAVCKVWKSLGAFIINADDLAKDLMTTDEVIKKEIIQAFGEQAYHLDGSLNRKYLAQQAFNHGRVKELNAIVHPRVPEKAEEQMQHAGKQGFDAVVYEAALLLQNLRPDELDYIVLVTADKESRIERVQKRDHTGRKPVISRMQKQQDFKQLTHLADIIIENNGSLNDLKQKAADCYHKILSGKLG